MAGIFGPAILVDTPNFDPKPSGLLQAATVLAMPDGHYRNGVLFRAPDCGNVAQFFDNCDTPSDPDPKTPTFHNPGTVTPIHGWDFYTYYDCRTGPDGSTTLVAEAKQGLIRGIPQAVEVAFWTDVLATNASVQLNSGGGTPVAVSLVSGVAALEDYIATHFAGVPTFHATRGASAFLRDHHQVIGQPGDQLETILGSKWAFYGGSVNTSPAGVVAPNGQFWIYATSQVTLWHSEIDTFPLEEAQQWQYGPTLDTGPLNVPTAIAEQHWTPSNFCVQAAVLVYAQNDADSTHTIAGTIPL